MNIPRMGVMDPNCPCKFVTLSMIYILKVQNTIRSFPSLNGMWFNCSCLGQSLLKAYGFEEFYQAWELVSYFISGPKPH